MMTTELWLVAVTVVVIDCVISWLIVDAWLFPLAAAPPFVATVAPGVTAACIASLPQEFLTVGFQTGIAATVFTSQH